MFQITRRPIRGARPLALPLFALAGLAAGQAHAAATPDECITDVSPTAPGEVRVVRCNGGNIDYSISVPPRCTEGGCGLIVDLPGAGVTADETDANTGLRARARDLPEPFIVINPQQPTATSPNFFNPALRGGGADEIFEFMQRAAEVFELDRDRIHVGGFSLGGVVTFNFLCAPEKAAFIASAAPHAAGQFPGAACFGDDPRLSNPNVPVLFFTGRRDALFPPAIQIQSADAIIAGLGLRDQGLIDSGPGGFEQRRFTGESGAILETIRFDNTAGAVGGHCYVGPVMGGGRFSCEGPAGFEHGAKLLEFYQAHPRSADSAR